MSKSSNASLISCLCSSVSSAFGLPFLRGATTAPSDGLLGLVACVIENRIESLLNQDQSSAVDTAIQMKNTRHIANINQTVRVIVKLVVVNALVTIFSVFIFPEGKTSSNNTYDYVGNTNLKETYSFSM